MNACETPNKLSAEARFCPIVASLKSEIQCEGLWSESRYKVVRVAAHAFAQDNLWFTLMVLFGDVW